MERRNVMKKKLLAFVGATLLALTMGACTPKTSPSSTPGGDTQVVTKYTVTFYVDGERFATKKVNEGEHITGVTNPTKEGYKFVGWLEGETLIDLETYVVTKDTRLDASFELDEGDVLSVDDVKEQGKSYYLVFGWWEVNDPSDPTKVTSSLTKPTVRLFYANMIKYLKLKTPAATDAEIANIQFRNYSSDTVANMGAAINADGDVDILIGVGVNIKTGGGVDYYDRFQTSMGAGPKDRYVVAPTVASDLGKETFAWLKDTDAGKAAFLRELTNAEIEASLAPEEINLAVTVHGDTNITTTLDDKDDVIEMPEITVPETKLFKGFATTENATAAQLNVAKNATLKYDDVKSLVAEGATTLDLYPVLEDKPTYEEDLMVFVHGDATAAELSLMKARFADTLTASEQEDLVLNFTVVDGDSAAYATAVGNYADILIGENALLSTYSADAQGALANFGAKHSASTDLKVLISDKVVDDHKALAKKFYDFAVAEAPEFVVHAVFWPKYNNSWVTEDEIATITAGMESNLKTYLNVTGEDTLLSKYNVKYTTESLTTNTDAGKDQVADLGNATRALRDGKGADLIVGCGKNIDSTGGFTGCPKKNVVLTQLSKDRYVALIHDNGLTRNIFDNYFVEKPANKGARL